IYGAVENQAQMIQGIALAASERKQTAEAVAYAMNQIAEITRQTTIATQDAANNMSYLAELAEQLRGSVATFRLPDRISEEAGLQATGYQPTATDAGLQDWVNGPQPLPALPPGPSGPIGAYSNMGGGMGGGMDGYPGYGEYAAGYDGYDGYNTSYDYPAVPGMTNGLAGQTGMGNGMGNGMGMGNGNGMGNGMGNGTNYGAPGNGQRGGYPGWPDNNNNDQFPPPDQTGGQSY
ncbi:MAG TPA: methyl-accepting chemotaxis protein, partial [Ktedonobacterales bacterium]|nr:methyl-accepting chemotaxis protein [Ktedonobacterales bacterium]